MEVFFLFHRGSNYFQILKNNSQQRNCEDYHLNCLVVECGASVPWASGQVSRNNL